MTSETRGKYGRRYYYKSVRVGGKVVKQYLGNGDLVSLTFNFDKSADKVLSSLQTTQRIERERRQEKERRADALIKAYLTETYQQIALYLAERGYHRPKRGVWRKRQESKMQQTPLLGALASALSSGRQQDAATTPPQTNKPGALYRQIETLFAAYTDDEKQRARLMDDFKAQFQAITGTPYTYLADTTLSPLDYLLAERVVYCRMQVALMEMRLTLVNKLPRITKQQETIDRQLSRAQNRYFAAIKLMAQVKQLSLPVVNVAMPGSTQVNIGEKQLNVSGAA